MATYRTRRTASGEVHIQARVAGVGAKTFTGKPSVARQDARTWAEEQERRKRLGELYVAPPETFGDLMDSFIERRRQTRRPKTVKNYEEYRRHLEPLAKHKQVTRAALEDCILERSPGNAAKVLRFAKAVLTDARDRGQVIDERCLTLKPPKHEGREARYLTMSELYSLSSWMPEFIRRIVLVAGLTGMREGELLDLKVSDLHLEDGYLKVTRSKTRAGVRKVHLGPELVTILREQLLTRSHSEYVFPAKRGGRFPADRLMSRYFRPAAVNAGLATDEEGYEGITFHDLRRTYASLMIRAGVDIRTIAGQMGHADGGALLLKRYGFMYEDAGPRAALAMNSLVKEDVG